MSAVTTPSATCMEADADNKTYALVSHESAVEAVWSLAARGWKGVLWDEDIWLVPDADHCVRTQGDFKALCREVDLGALGIRRVPTDLLVPNKSCYSRGKRAVFHVWADFFPPRSFVRVHDRVFVSTPYFLIVQLAVAKPVTRLSRAEAQRSAQELRALREQAGLDGPELKASDLVTWKNIERFVRATQVLCDFMGTYRYVPAADKANPGDPDIIYRTKPIVTRSKVDQYLLYMPAERGSMRARKVLRAALENSASPMETMLALMLTLPVSMGGFGLPRPELNYEIGVDPEERDLASKETMFADICWSKKRVIVEYYGWKDHFAAGPRKVAEDAARANSLTTLGWTVLHVTFEQAKTLEGVSLLARQIARCLDVDLRTPTELELLWRMRLISMLLPAVSWEE